MRFVLNTRSEDMASRVCIHELQRRLVEAGVEAVANDWDGYQRYDVALFLGYDHDMESARRQNPRLRIGLADPKQSRAEWIQAARDADFLLVSSLEQRDAFLRLNRNIHVHWMLPELEAREKRHAERERLVIGYHGNRVHLEAMRGGLQLALEELGRRRPLELLMIYDLERLGRACLGLPDERVVPQRHVQWSTAAYHETLAHADVGIVPSLLPIRDKLDVLEKSAYPEPEFCYEPFDHLLRFKASTNPGRIYPFARLGIPVVADVSPSACQFIEDGVSGLLASSPHAWFEALSSLAGSPELRGTLAARLRARADEFYAAQIPAFLAFCSATPRPQPIEIAGHGAEDELARRARYGRPKGAGPLRAVRRRLRRIVSGR